MEDPVEVRLPGGDCLLVILRISESRQQISPAFLDDFLLNSCYGSAIDGTVSKQYFMCHNHWLDLRRQLPNRFVHGPAESTCLPFVDPSVKGSTHACAG